jgi:fumarylacetoacetate (FAA) hydrolase
MSFGDRIEIDMVNSDGESVFGKIDQRVVQYFPPTA